jgi:hypothetical protein
MLWQIFFFASVRPALLYQRTSSYNTLRDDLRGKVDLFSLDRKTIRCNRCRGCGVQPKQLHVISTYRRCKTGWRY